MNKTIAVFGSSRRNGNTGQLIDLIAKELNIDVIDLDEKNITPFDYQHKNIDDDFLPLMEHILNHDNIIFASPVYWFSMSAQMKIFIDRTSDFLDVESLKEQGRRLRGKTGYIVSTSISDNLDASFIDTFTHTLDYLGMTYGGFMHVNCEHGFNADHCKSDIITFSNKIRKD